jgi:threonine/homoserine/homoserine lactone efflux protein
MKIGKKTNFINIRSTTALVLILSRKSTYFRKLVSSQQSTSTHPTMSFEILLAFAATEFFLSLTPGPAVLTVVSQGIRHGAKQSVQGTFGILTGNAVYFFISAIGVGAALAASEFLFTAVRYLGAAYIIFIGGKMIVASLSGSSDAELAPTESTTTGLYLQGLTTQLANPKAIIFFTALLPQFVDPTGNVALQCFVLGVVSVGVEFPVLVFYGIMAARGRMLLQRKSYSRWVDRVAGLFLVGAGIKLALTKQ